MDSQNTKKQRTITLSFNDNDCIIIDDELKENQNQFLPRRNLNGLCIDLTGESPNLAARSTSDLHFEVVAPEASTSKPKNDQQGQNEPKNNILKTIELNMSISDFTTPKASTSTAETLNDINNNQPGCSKNLMPCHQNLLEAAKKNLIENAEDFVCSLCFNYILRGKGVTLTNCLHNFCRECLKQSIYKLHDPKTGAVKCPLIVEKCNTFLNEEEIEELLGNAYEVLLEQVKYNIEQDIETEERKKAENVSILPVLLNMDLETIPNFSAFECSICFVQIEPGNGIVLQNCLHNFCKECLSGCIEAAEEFEVKCPHVDNNLSCKEFLREREIRMLVTAEIFEKHLLKSLKLAEHANELSFHCRTPDCHYFVEIEEGVESFKCLKCQRTNCIKCKAIHEGKSCIEYQEDQNPNLKADRINKENFMSEDMIKKMIENQEAMYCPRCNIPVIKISGCDFITCTACKLGICWVTKKPRNDLKKADGTVILGCKCGQPNKCHPKCGNCH